MTRNLCIFPKKKSLSHLVEKGQNIELHYTAILVNVNIVEPKTLSRLNDKYITKNESVIILMMATISHHNFKGEKSQTIFYF